MNRSVLKLHDIWENTFLLALHVLTARCDITGKVSTTLEKAHPKSLLPTIAM